MPAILGLRYGTVALTTDDNWVYEFDRERCRLADALSTVPCEIEHVGSTAVSGLVAQPILDIAVAIDPSYPRRRAFPMLEALGYIHRGDAGAHGGQIFVRESSALVRTHHLHLVARDDPQWDNYLAIRDYLRANEAARDRYAAVKRELASRFGLDRKAYTAAKAEVVEALLDAARR